MKTRTWTDEEFIAAVHDSYSIAEVLRHLNLRPVGGNYQTVKQYLRRFQLNTSHWTGQHWRKGNQHPVSPPKPLTEILVKHSTYTNTSRLRLRLIREGILGKYCARCTLTDWCDQPLSLHLDHKNGDRTDNRLENLWLLCPNCHSQTDTYCGRNIGR